MTKRYEIVKTDKPCRYCELAEALLIQKKLPYHVSLLDTYEKQQAFLNAGFSTVPQIYENGDHVGGYDELAARLS